jgi:hypothetical protein
MVKHRIKNNWVECAYDVIINEGETKEKGGS